jgi:DNA-directed RNA polymerase II subunit RPB3
MKPIIEIINYDNDYMKFKLKNVDISFVNSLRRIMISEIPTFAIDIVTIEKNDSNIPDETLAHKLGLIPIHLENIDCHLTNCTCAFECPICTLKFECNINCQTEKLEITSKDIYPNHKWNLQKALPVIYKIDNTFYPISILNLYKGQKLIFNANAKLGIGKNHSKWSCVSIATYVYDSQQHEFIFSFESNGSFKSIDILKKSLQIMYNKLNSLQNIKII